MTIKSIDLAWIVVKDFKSAIKFYTETVGLKLEKTSEEYGWAELTGHNGGMRLGIAQKGDHETVEPGSNAIVTLTIADLVKAKNDMITKGAKMLGDIMEVPGHVKMQTILDKDGNRLQLVEVIKEM